MGLSRRVIKNGHGRLWSSRPSLRWLGRGIAAAIMEMLTTGRWGQLERLAGSTEPEQLFRTIPVDVDRECREKAASGRLRKIAPKRFKQHGQPGFPGGHTRRDDWQFPVLFSNTQLAHQLRKTRDWVVIYFQTDTEVEGQCTVVTESRGPLRGRRVVRGRERDCEVHYGSGSAIA